MPLLLLPWLANLRPIYKIGSCIALVLAWFILINHSFRTIFVEYLVILPLIFIFARQYFKVSFVVLIASLICGYLLNLLYSDVIMAVVNSGVGSTDELLRSGDSGRSLVWKEAFFGLV